MDTKIIIKVDDLNSAIFLFLKEVGVGLTIDWNVDAFEFVRDGAIRAFEKMGNHLEIDEQP